MLKNIFMFIFILGSAGIIIKALSKYSMVSEKGVTDKSSFQKAWWIKINTKIPQCTYYFGPFGSKSEADSCKGDYVQDLLSEGAQNILVKIQYCQPKVLTAEW